MTEPHIDHANERLHNPQHTASNSNVKRPRDPNPILKRLRLVLILAGLCGLMLSGCDNFWDTAADLIRIDGGNAEAQTDTERRVETYVIMTDTFSITVDNDGDISPMAVINDSATEFTMRSNGTVSFDTSSGRSTDLELELDDIIIFRPNGATGTVTLIRVD